MHTMSMCPECAKVLNAECIEQNGKIIIQKHCSEHGDFKDVYWSDANLYRKFERLAQSLSGISNFTASENPNCPSDCGMCQFHKTSTLLGNIDVTNRCNMSCPVCFANAQKSGMLYEPDMDQILSMLSMLRNQQPVPCYAVQFSGGEPTVRSDLPKIISMAKDLGFVHIQIATNGVKIAKSIEYAKELKDAGLSTVYLSFDGIKEETYRIMRGFNALPMKQKAIKNCRQAGLTSITLVPTLKKGINDDQIGDIINLASQNMDVIKGINFQPVAFTGRIDNKDREKTRITISDLMLLVEEQTNGQICRDDWYPVSTVVPISRFVSAVHGRLVPEFTIHPHCGAATYIYKDGDRLIPITHFVDVEGLLELLNEVTEEIENTKYSTKKAILVSKTITKISSFIDKEKIPVSIDVTKLMLDFFKIGSAESAKPFHRNSLFLGAMHFQDLYNLDLKRVERCGIHYATPDGRVIPFCSYNILHRQDVESRFSKPYIKGTEN
ncbi:MAG: radical SAM protein [Methanomethylovorans sp.]|nr:radical SAM protein [Methanomethylovorans sp.]